MADEDGDDFLQEIIDTMNELKEERAQQAVRRPTLFTFMFPDSYVEKMVEAEQESDGPHRGPRLAMTTEQCDRVVEKGIVDPDQIADYEGVEEDDESG